MIDAKQESASDDALVALKRQADWAVSLADWVNQMPPPPDPGTTARDIDEQRLNDFLNKLAGELARIAACFQLKEAKNRLVDEQVLNGDSNLVQGAIQNIEAAQNALGCPGAS